MNEIKTADPASGDYMKFREWILEEWNTVGGLPGESGSAGIPLPLLGYCDGVLAGGLSFTEYKNPEQGGEALWINTLYVDQAFRRRKIAQTLIAEAEKLCAQKGYPVIYVYTEIPALYSRIGWTELENDGENYILKYML